MYIYSGHCRVALLPYYCWLPLWMSCRATINAARAAKRGVQLPRPFRKVSTPPTLLVCFFLTCSQASVVFVVDIMVRAFIVFFKFGTLCPAFVLLGSFSIFFTTIL